MTTQLNVGSTLLDDVNPVVLNKSDRQAVRRLAADLTLDPDAAIDTTEWMDQARELSNQLPLGLRESLRRFRRDPGREGVLLVRGLPVMGPNAVPTPNVAGSVQRRPTEPAGALVLACMQVGDVVSFRQEKGGALVHDVVPVPGQEDFQGNAGSVTLKMHTENAFHEHTPDYVALLCLRNDHDNVAGLRTSCVRRAVELLPRQIREVLGQPRFVTSPPPSFGNTVSFAGPRPVLEGDPEDPNIRVDFSATDPVDVVAATALDQLREAFDQVRRTFILQPGDLAIVDNRLSLHGRTSFHPRYDGEDRWLQRVYIQLDPRRSRVARAGGGNILT
ncbi:TauD/TfdA family dioxygenase [Lentzea sp. NPDC051213]|uniref:TauD/TfdA family dioxygenase n=1 Tax=Lentzea sp. NPDC051213 TaxID=3364126 RepID=UPI00378764F0